MWKRRKSCSPLSQVVVHHVLHSSYKRWNAVYWVIIGRYWKNAESFLLQFVHNFFFQFITVHHAHVCSISLQFIIHKFLPACDYIMYWMARQYVCWLYYVLSNGLTVVCILIMEMRYGENVSNKGLYFSLLPVILVLKLHHLNLKLLPALQVFFKVHVPGARLWRHIAAASINN